MFGAVSIEGKQLFRQYEKFNEDTFYEFLKHVRHKFPECYLFLDKAPHHYRSDKLRKYLKRTQRYMVLEECWNIPKNDLLVLRYYPSFAEFRA